MNVRQHPVNGEPFSTLPTAPAWRTQAARSLSILGHPGVVMPAALFLRASRSGGSSRAVLIGALVTLAMTGGLLLLSFAQVRSGRWKHVDASVPSERRQLNRILLLLLVVGACTVKSLGGAASVVVGLVVGAFLVAIALAFSRWMKVSLHVGFAVYAAALLWPLLVPAVVLVILSFGIAWSRLVLQRHTRQEVIVGFLGGAFAGVLFHLLLR